MLKSTVTEALTDRKVVIAALAVTALMAYAFTFPINVAQANHGSILNRVIDVPVQCEPYCAGVPNEINISPTSGVVHILIRFGFL